MPNSRPERNDYQTPAVSAAAPEPGTEPEENSSGRSRFLTALPWIWLALTAIWLAVLFLTAVPAWTLVIWISTTIGLPALVRTRLTRGDKPGT